MMGSSGYFQYSKSLNGSYINIAHRWYFLFSFGRCDHISALLRRLPITHRVKSKLLSWAHETHLSRSPLELINAPSRLWFKTQPSGHVNHVFFLMSLCLCQNDPSEINLVMPFSCSKQSSWLLITPRKMQTPQDDTLPIWLHLVRPHLFPFSLLCPTFCSSSGHMTGFPHLWDSAQAVSSAVGASLCPTMEVPTFRPSSSIKTSWTL